MKIEEWSEKDLIYAIGSVDSDLKRLWFIYGDCYAAEKRVYERLTDTLDKGIHEIPDVEFHTTNELANVKKVDPFRYYHYEGARYVADYPPFKTVSRLGVLNRTKEVLPPDARRKISLF